MTEPTEDKVLVDVWETVKDAGATRVPPWLAVVSALAVARPATLRETFVWLDLHREEIERRYEAGATGPLTTSSLPADLQYSPELGSLDRSIEDHWLRERRVFTELLGQQTFTQATVYAVAGIALSTSDSAMIEQIGIACLTVDRRAWPMAVTRRVAGRGGGIAAALVAGAAMMGSPILAGPAAADCARFLRRAAIAEGQGTTVEATIKALLDRRERVMGFGRPAVGPDERSPVLEGIMRKYGRGDGPFVSLLRRAEPVFFDLRGLRTTAAAWVAAMLSDLGLSPEAVHALTNHWLTVCVLAQATFADAHARPDADER